MNKKLILVTATLLMIVAASSIAIPSVAAQSATRTLPADSVEPGETFEVEIVATDYGIMGQVVETLPDGFSYVDSSLSPASVVQDGQTVTFTFLGDPVSFTYHVTASSVEGTYTFSGILKDEDLNEYPVGGDTEVEVATSVPTATRTLPADSVEPGETFEVGIAATDYGIMGQVVETLPDGFSYVDSSLPADSVEPVGQTVKFTLLEETSFTYNVIASSTVGTYTFSGILKDEDKSEYDVGGDTGVVVATSVPTATRTLPTDSVEPDETFEVIIAATDYGVMGQVVETLPDGFSYVDSSLPAGSVEQDGQTVEFTLLGETSFTYNVAASSTVGTYTFSGILKDADLNEYPVGGDSSITVVTPPRPRGGGKAPDSDGDGYSDSYETRMGTDPKDKRSYPGGPVVTPTTPAVTPTPTPSPTPTAAPHITTPTPTPTEEPTPTPTEPPGFEAVFAIAGLLAVAYLVVRRKKR